jgi:tetratricopeptide (TPR) repeat protein
MMPLNGANTMNSYELRSEILSGGNRYHIQSNAVPAQQAVVTSLFHEGDLLSKQQERYASTLSDDQVRAHVRRVHDERRMRITSLLEIRDVLKKDADGKSHLKLGEALHKQKLYREAMAEVIRAIKLGLEDSGGYTILGNCLLALGDREKALKSFQKGIEISPDYPDLYNDLGRTYLSLSRCRDAVTAFEKALELNRYYHTAFINLALALARNVVLKQDYELSRDLQARMKKTLQMCVQLRPALDTPEFRSALEAVGQERYDVVHEKLSAILEDEEKIALTDLSLELYLVLKFRSDVLYTDEIDRYIEQIQAALEANPGYADLQNDLGVLYAAKCKVFIDKAHECFRGALGINQNFKKAEKNLKLAANDRQGIHFLLRALLD